MTQATGKFKIDTLERRLEELSALSIDFIALLSASTLIATLGLFENSAAVIIGAMIVAPLMRPLVGLSLAILTSDLLLLRRALLTLLVGSILGVCISAIVALILHQLELTTEILARTKPTLLDLAIAVFAGGIGAYCQANEKVADSIAGVAIAVALVPPLSVVGIGIAFQQTELWQGALLLYLTNLVGITIAGAIVFLAMGYVQLNRAKQGLIVSASALLVLVVPLGFSMNNMILANRLNNEIQQILKEKTLTFRSAKLRDVQVNKYTKPIKVEATVFTDQQITSRQVRMVQEFLVKELQTPLDFRLKVIPLTEIQAEDPNEIKNETTSTPADTLPEPTKMDNSAPGPAPTSSETEIE